MNLFDFLHANPCLGSFLAVVLLSAVAHIAHAARGRKDGTS